MEKNLFENFKKLDKEVFVPPMENHNKFNCYISILPQWNRYEYEHLDFFERYNFVIGYNLYDSEWENEVQLEEIFKKIMIMFNFKDLENLVIERGEKIIHLPDGRYTPIPKGGIFLYDKSKIKVDVEQLNK